MKKLSEENNFLELTHLYSKIKTGIDDITTTLDFLIKQDDFRIKRDKVIYSRALKNLVNCDKPNPKLNSEQLKKIIISNLDVLYAFFNEHKYKRIWLKDEHSRNIMQGHIDNINRLITVYRDSYHIN